jgi:uncharacterized protein
LDLSENIQMSWTFMAAVFSAGLLGSGHCAGMCGPLAHFVSKHWTQNLLYNLGRLSGYVALGVIVGNLGELFLESELTWLRYTAAALMVFFVAASCLSMFTKQNYFAKIVRMIVPQFLVARLFRIANKTGDYPKALLVGLLTVAIPCGWLMTFAAVAGASASPLIGGAVMATFWLSTLPVMTLLPLKGHGLLKRFGAKSPIVVSIILCSASLFVIGIRFYTKDSCH